MARNFDKKSAKKFSVADANQFADPNPQIGRLAKISFLSESGLFAKSVKNYGFWRSKRWDGWRYGSIELSNDQTKSTKG